MLLLDAGNALWSRQELARETQGKVMIEGMNIMGYDAMVIGDLDLQLGPDVLRQRIAEAQFPILSANVLLADSREPLAQPYAVLERGGRKVGVIGLTSELAHLTLAASADAYVVLQASEVLPQYISELAQQTEIIIVLSNMGYDEDQRLPSLAPAIDLIVGGRSRLSLSEGWRHEQTGAIVVQAGAEGQAIGRCEMHLNSAGMVARHSCELLLLTEEYPDDAEMRAFLDSYPVQ